MLTADTSTLADADGLGTLHYQWQRDTAPASSMSARSGDLHAGRCRCRRQSPGGGELHRRPGHGGERRPALRPLPIANVNDAPTGGVTISGTATEDQVLTADTRRWPTPTGSARCTTSGSATPAPASSMSARSGDLHPRRCRCRRRGPGGGELHRRPGHGRERDQRGDAPIANVNDAPTGGVTISGTATEDQVLTADTSTLADADGLGTLHYQWQRDPAPASSMSAPTRRPTRSAMPMSAPWSGWSSATPTARARPRASTSAATAPIANVNDAPTGGVTISGTATEDQVLTADTSTLADADGLGTLITSGSATAPASSMSAPTGDLHARRRRCRRRGPGGGQLHRRAGHRRRASTSAATAADRQRQRCRDRRRDDQRHGDRGPGADRRHLDAGRCRRARHAALPVAARPAPASSMSAPTRPPTRSAMPMSAPWSGWW